MRQILFLIAFSLSISIGVAQCPTFLTLTNQQEIDDFAVNYPDCDGTGLSLEINNEITPITNLNGLSQLTTLSSLGIFFTNATDLSGLDNITNIAFHLRILGNSDLETLNGLQSLETIGNGLRIIINESLVSLDGLSGLTEIIGDVDISGNTDLQSLSGLHNLTRVIGSIEIKSLPDLTDLLGLASLTEVGLSPADRFYIYNNPQVESLAGLENVQTVNGTLELRLNNNLASITELSSLTTVTEGINFQNNSELSFCAIEVICNNLDNNNIDLVFENNALGCSSLQEVEDSCFLTVDDPVLENLVSLYPNPVRDALTITTTIAITIQQIKVYTISGAEVISSSEIIIDLSNLSSGIYLLEATTNLGLVTRKIVKD